MSRMRFRAAPLTRTDPGALAPEAAPDAPASQTDNARARPESR